MQIAHSTAHYRAGRRAAYGLLAAVVLAAAVAGAVIHGSGWWLLAAFAIGPDIALLLGISSTLEKGQLHPRAVRLYNAAHSLWGPALLTVATVALPSGYLIGALAWAFHVSLDRALGYGMRTRDGFQRS
jgi:Domain of unknown function (DUF4260)